jgi:hypothetical protein
MMQKALRLALIALMLCGFAAQAEARQMEAAGIAVLRTIDKRAGRTSTFEIPVDKTVKFGRSLFIRLRACRKSSPIDLPESAAFLQVWERKPLDEKANWVFSGWMFASNPSMSAMDHPVYDVWVIECKDAADTTAKVQPFTSEKAPDSAPETEAPVVEKNPAPATSAETETTPPEAAPETPAAAPEPTAAPVIAPSFEEAPDTGD